MSIGGPHEVLPPHGCAVGRHTFSGRSTSITCRCHQSLCSVQLANWAAARDNLMRRDGASRRHGTAGGLAMNEVPASTQARLDEMASKFDVLAERLLGYPQPELRLLGTATVPELLVNNVGDPFHGSSFGTNTHDIERDVILRFASLLRLPHDEAWGYVTNGGTEGNCTACTSVASCSRRDRLLLRGHPLQRAENHTRAEGTQHHDQEPAQR